MGLRVTREKSQEGSATNSRRPLHPTAVRASQSGLIPTLLALQRSHGNQFVLGLLQNGADVQIHSGPDAKARARAQGAVAYASGRDVYLGESVDLASDMGQRILAHEMTHVVQQERGRAGIPLASQESLEGEASAVSGVGPRKAPSEAGGAAPGTVQRLTEVEEQGVPTSREQEQRWDAELERDEARLVAILTSVYYSDSDEAETISILQRWAARRTRAVSDHRLGLRSDLLDRLFARLDATRVWTRTGPTSAYEAMFQRFDRANEVRTIRDTSSINYVGREEEAAKARAARKEEDELAESLFGWQVNKVEAAPPAKSPTDIARANWVIRTLAAIPSDQLTPEQRVLSEGIAREGRDFLLKRTHVVTASDRLRFGKQLLREAVVTMLEYAAAELTLGAARAVAPKILEGIVGAETAGAAGRTTAEVLPIGEVIEPTATPLAEHPEGFFEGAVEPPPAPKELPLEPTATPLAGPSEGSLKGALELPEAPAEIPMEPTAHPPASAEPAAAEHGFEVSEAETGPPLESSLETQKRQVGEFHPEQARRPGSTAKLPKETRTETPLESLGYEKARARSGYFTGAKPKIQTSLDFVESLSLPEKHHFWPKYLGGIENQTLKAIPRHLHKHFHSALRAWRGGIFDFAPATGAPAYTVMETQQIIDELRLFYQSAEGGLFREFMPDFEGAVQETLDSMRAGVP